MSADGMRAMRVTVTGATGLIGRTLVPALQGRGAEVTVLTRDPARARTALADSVDTAIEAVGWEPLSEPAPPEALAGRDAVLHLAGEPVAQRWSTRARRAIHDSRVLGTRNLLAGLRTAAGSDRRPRTLISSSAIGYYGAHGEEPLDEETPPGSDFLARVCVDWELEASRASELGLRVVHVRTGVVLDAGGGALGKMLPPFRIGLGGPVAGGRQYISWIHVEDLVGLMLTALEQESWSGPVNATAPEPVTNRAFSKALGRVLGRPALLPVPALALQLLYGEMAEIVTTGARVVPAKPLVLGYEFSHPALADALRSALTPA
ncbi:MAG TPA: TIGR01777 family oxidoreductase [Solirubrobacteraceae bacterium]|nr:TIGR01777 family oxidoreductase [Solirubrobacteraceae bacterium]